MRIFVALAVDTEEARGFVTTTLGWQWLERQDPWSAHLAAVRTLPELGIWSADVPGSPQPGSHVWVSGGDDNLWGGPIRVEILPDPGT